MKWALEWRWRNSNRKGLTKEGSISTSHMVGNVAVIFMPGAFHVAMLSLPVNGGGGIQAAFLCSGLCDFTSCEWKVEEFTGRRSEGSLLGLKWAAFCFYAARHYFNFTTISR